MPLGPHLPSTTPVGVRDLPPALTTRFVQLETALVDTFAAGGYQRVITPAFELAEVFERGLDPHGAARLLRFVDPQNGEVLALRSDITPQIARLVSGPMADTPAPLRLCYFGRVFRLRVHSEFQRREVAQAGVELVGPADAAADVELLSLCDRALIAATGADTHRLSIGHVGIIEAAFGGLGLSEEGRWRLLEYTRQKDLSGLQATAAELGLEPARAQAIGALATLYGPAPRVLAEAQPLLAAIPGMSEPLERLAQVAAGLNSAGLDSAGLADRCLLDLGEVLGVGYYTGLVFRAYLPNVGHAVGSGGRYDGLLARYGRDLPAAGFALDEEGLSD